METEQTKTSSGRKILTKNRTRIGIIIRFLKKVFFRMMHLRSDTDVEGTIKGIKDGIILKGSQLWILICSVMIACIGLDTNSPAVIIGAMLISPLMSPILGIGLSAGLNDRETLKLSLRNFAAATALSLSTSVLYFLITPFGTLTPEMMARTEPTILDAFVAFFGGLAGIIAGSRTEKTNAIPGVAIATALMPPLCTSGFGIASGRVDVFFAAFYLFAINAILISLSTYLIVRFLNFPQVASTDLSSGRRTRLMVYSFLILVLIPSILFLLSSLHKAAEKNAINNFIKRYIHEDVEKGVQWTHAKSDSNYLLKVYYFGEYIKPDSVRVLETRFAESLKKDVLLGWLLTPPTTQIELTPTDAPPDEEKAQLREDIKNINSKVVVLQHIQERELNRSQQITDSLQREVQRAWGDSVPFNQIQAELGALFPEMKAFSLGRIPFTQFDSAGTRLVFLANVQWEPSVSRPADKKYRADRLSAYLKVKLQADTVRVVTY